MQQPFIYKYQPLFLKDFEIEEDLYLLIKSLIKMDSLNILLLALLVQGKTH